MEKLKVLLANPPGFSLDEFDRDQNKIRAYTLYPPVSLTTIAASVLNKVSNVEIEILDLDFEMLKYFRENEKSPLSTRDVMKRLIIDKMEQFPPDLCGIGVMFSTIHGNALEVANIVKQKTQDIKIICGGNHATFAYKRMLEKCPSIDFIFLYEADNSFPSFLEYMKGNITFKELKGIAWLDKSTNEVKLTAYDSLIHELDSLPIPAWNLVPIREYQKHGRMGSVHRYGDLNAPSYVMQTVRGCVASCSFCSVRSFYGKGVRAYSAKRVLEEIDYLYNDLGIKQLEILDDDFSFDRKRTLEICNALIKRNYDLEWNMNNGIRLGTLNDEVVLAMIEAKCRAISIGVESGNDTTLAIVRKPLSIKMLYRKTEIFKKYPELYVMGNYMVGFPFENYEQMMNTYKVAEDIAFDWSKFSVFHPLPGTPEFQKLDEESKETYDFSAIRYNMSFEDARNYKKEIEKQMRDSLMHGEKEGNHKSQNQKRISQLAYIKNLEINFIRNKNLNGKNVDRAIKDFEGILKFIEEDHAIAHYCLTKAYSYKGQIKMAKKHANKIFEILANPLRKTWVEYFDKLISKNEMNKLKILSTNANIQAQQISS